MNYASPARARLTESALRYIARFFFAAVALTAVGSAAIFMSLPPDIPIGRRDLLTLPAHGRAGATRPMPGARSTSAANPGSMQADGSRVTGALPAT